MSFNLMPSVGVLVHRRRPRQFGFSHSDCVSRINVCHSWDPSYPEYRPGGLVIQGLLQEFCWY